MVVAGIFGGAQLTWNLVAPKARQAAEAEAAADASAALTGKVGEVATGLTGLRSEVHELRNALQDHAAATDERLRHHEAGLGELRSEVIASGATVVIRPDSGDPTTMVDLLNG